MIQCMKRALRLSRQGFIQLVEGGPNNTLQATFDPLPTFAAAKAAIASNAPERGR